MAAKRETEALIAQLKAQTDDSLLSSIIVVIEAQEREIARLSREVNAMRKTVVPDPADYED